MTLKNLSDKEEKALRGYVSTLEGRFGSQLAEILLFGSKARSEGRPGSDLDVAVILRQPSAQDLSEARGLAFDIWLAYGILLAIRAMSQQGWEDLARLRSLLYRNVKRDGISVFSKAA